MLGKGNVQALPHVMSQAVPALSCAQAIPLCLTLLLVVVMLACLGMVSRLQPLRLHGTQGAGVGAWRLIATALVAWLCLTWVGHQYGRRLDAERALRAHQDVVLACNRLLDLISSGELESLDRAQADQAIKSCGMAGLVRATNAPTSRMGLTSHTTIPADPRQHEQSWWTASPRSPGSIWP